ncbi:MAG: GTP cyclohydrolase, FolE2/MptA family, partial [candidate division WOR-3 bacterium]
MEDIRKQRPEGSIPIDKVGVKNLRYPIVLLDRAHKRQHTIATISMFVDLPKEQRGTFMGRFVEILNRYHREIDVHRLGTILREM